MNYKTINLNDFAKTIDLYNTLIRLGLAYPCHGIADLQAQFDIMKYRSFEAINEKHTEAKYESNE